MHAWTLRPSSSCSPRPARRCSPRPRRRPTARPSCAVGRRLRASPRPAYVAAALTQVGPAHGGRVASWARTPERMYLHAGGARAGHPGTVAAHRAGRVAAPGHQSLLDLGCGVGADLVAFARRGLRVLGVEPTR